MATDQQTHSHSHITRTLRTHLRYISFEYRILIVFSQLLVLFFCFNSQPNSNQSNDEPNETWRQILTTHVFYCVHVFVNGRERVCACVPARICVFVCVSDPFTTHNERRDFNACVNLSYGNVTEESKCDSTSNPVSIHKHQFTWQTQPAMHSYFACLLLLTHMNKRANERAACRWILVCISSTKQRNEYKAREKESSTIEREQEREQKAMYVVREPNT